MRRVLIAMIALICIEANAQNMQAVLRRAGVLSSVPVASSTNWWPADALTNCVAYWRPGISGDATDSVGGYDGTYVDNASATIGTGFILDGDDDYINIVGSESDVNFDFSKTNLFSIAAWQYTTSTVNQSVLAKYDSGNDGYMLFNFYTASSMRGLLQLEDGGYKNKYGDTDISGGWHFIVGTYDGSDTTAGIIIYTDGVAGTGAEASYGTLGTCLNVVTVKIGCRKSAELDFCGNIDEVAVFNDVLTATEIGEYYTNSLTEFGSR